ncbi:class I SAM-dependent methyltransferase [bacterium]|nr:MAG: class I SAM-dependent methyltransferase [bacterium]
MMRICPLTGSSDFTTYYKSSEDRVMTSDQRIIPGKLHKIIFLKSGIVANAHTFSNEELYAIYGTEYELNTSESDEHIFYTESGPISRSQVYFEWIRPYFPNTFESLVEVGCGEGRVLEKIAVENPDRKIIGFDGSHKAANLGKRRGLKISQKLIFKEEELPKSDVFVLLGVMEHIEDIGNLLTILINSLTENGRIILSVPVQNNLAYDFLFADHVWHFTTAQFKDLLNKYGLDVIHVDDNHKINHGFGLFVCEKKVINAISTANDKEIMLRNLEFWKSKFSNFDIWIGKQILRKIAVFGASEIFTLFMAYTALGKQHIIACIDDTKKDGDLKHGIPIHHSEWLRENEVELLLLAVNKKYHKMIEEKFAGLNLNIHPIY